MLVIYAHPNKNGHCGQVLRKIDEILQEKKQSYEMIDLYSAKYDPVLKQTEHYTSGNYSVSAMNKNYQKLLKKHDRWIIIYPTWWNGTPAILKGFWDRVIVRGFGFRYIKGLPKGLLSGKKALVITSTGGPVWYEKWLAGNRSLLTVTKDVLKFCGVRSKTMMIGKATKLTDEKKSKINKKLKRVIKYLIN